jgi:hypothetical protein
MELSDLLRQVAGTLECLQIKYLVTGSMATIAYGEPRFTNDIDIVADIPPEQVGPFCAAFPEPDYYCPRDMVEHSVRRRFQFNILHPESGLKVDVMPATDGEFDRARLGRAIRLKGGTDFEVWFASPEDVIIKKLEYYKEGGSQKHVRDILGVLKIRGDRVDREYIESWSNRLGLSAEWNEILGSENPSSSPTS